MKQSGILPAFAVLGSIISLTVGTSYGKYLFPALGPAGTAAARVVFAAVILLVVRRPWRRPLKPKDAGAIFLYGATLGLMNLVFYQSLATLPLGIAIAIEFTGPLTIAVISSRRTSDFLWIGLAVVGLALLIPMSPGSGALNPIGVCFAFSSAILWALYIVFGKRLAHLDGGQSTALGMSVAAVVILPIAIGLSGPRLFQPNLFLAGVGLAIASSAVPYTLEMYALKRLPKNTFGILLSMEPAVGALSAFLILGETLSLVHGLAIASIISASIGAALTAKSREPEVTATAETIPADVL